MHCALPGSARITVICVYEFMDELRFGKKESSSIEYAVCGVELEESQETFVLSML